MDTYRVSIIIPVYNVAQYIEACLQSVANQTLTEGMECIIVDDCGTDSSMELVEQFVSDYTGELSFTILHHENNRGLSAARNTGIMAAKGEYVYFLDSDDSITPDCIAGFYGIINKYPGVDLIQGLIDQDSPYMNQFSSKVLPAYTEDRKYIKKALLDYDELPVCAANKMIRRDLLVENGLWFKEGIIHEDNYLSFFLAKHVKSLAVYPKKCYLYIVNLNSITKDVNVQKETLSYKTMINDFCNSMDDYMKGEQKAAIACLLNNVISNHYYVTNEQKNYLVSCLIRKCCFHEKLLLTLWAKTTEHSSMRDRLFRMILKLFRLQNYK